MEPWRAAVERLCKWRTVLTGWHLGTATTNQPGVAAMRDLHEARLIARAELSALTKLLLDRGTFTLEEFRDQIGTEADALSKMYEQLFPGYRATDDGVEITPGIAAETARIRGFPP